MRIFLFHAYLFFDGKYSKLSRKLGKSERAKLGRCKPKILKT
jgi:hypothetical protein